MAPVNIHDAKTHLSRLIERAQRGEEVVIAKAGKPVVKLTAIRPRKRAKFGFGKGTVRGDFSGPLDDELLDLFYNAPLVSNENSARHAHVPLVRQRRSKTLRKRAQTH